MKVLIIGASGKTGKLLVEKAIEKNYKVRIYARDTSRIISMVNVEIIQGQLEEVEKLSKAMVGVDAVLVALGNKASQMSKPLFVHAVPNIIKAMKMAGIKRVINLSALGSGITYDNAGFPCNIFAKTILKANFEDHSKGEQEFYSSDLEWTNIHPALLYTGTSESTQTRVFTSKSREKVWGLSMTSRHDIAALMLNIIREKSSYNQSLILVSKRIF
ncbi:MAG: SDR family oxidoreductase [Gemella sp.]|nr:SDR family oxidoreductase [Gemella sp.]